MAATGHHAALGSFNFILDYFDWNHWLKGIFNDLLYRVLTRCWQKALYAGHMAKMDRTFWTPTAQRTHGVSSKYCTQFLTSIYLCPAVKAFLLRSGKLQWFRCFWAVLMFAQFGTMHEISSKQNNFSQTKIFGYTFRFLLFFFTLLQLNMSWWSRNVFLKWYKI